MSTLTKWCQENHLSLNIVKTKELVVDYRRQSREHTPITIDKTPVERVTSFKFLGVHITEDLTWSAHTDAVLKKVHQRLFFLRRLRKFGSSPRILRSFYTCTVESILTGCITAWYGNSTAGNRRALQRVVRTARHIVGGELPSFQDIYTRRCISVAVVLLRCVSLMLIKDFPHKSGCAKGDLIAAPSLSLKHCYLSDFLFCLSSLMALQKRAHIHIIYNNTV